MTRTMYDSVTVADLPTGGDLYLGYVDGLYANIDAIRKRFPKKTVVGVTVTGATLTAQVADVEPGDLTPAQGAAWAKRKIAAGQHPTLYTYAAQWPALKAAVDAAGITGKVSYLIADYDGDPTVPKGAVGKQYLGSPGNSPGHYDVSVVRDNWPGVDPPKPPPTRAISDKHKSMVRELTRALGGRKSPLDERSRRALMDLKKAANHALKVGR